MLNSQDSNFKPNENDKKGSIIENDIIEGLLFIGNFRNVRFQTEEPLNVVVHGFWTDSTISKECRTDKKINLLKTFSVIRNEIFLEKVRNNHLQIELNQESNLVVGIAKLPVHQFFIAFKDSEITSRLFQEVLPVISIEDWVPVINPITKECCGYLQSLLAMGKNEQINRLKEKRGLYLTNSSHDSDQIKNTNNFNNISNAQKPVYENFSKQKYARMSSSNLGNFIENLIQQRNFSSNLVNSIDEVNDEKNSKQVRMRKTSDLLDALNKALATPPCENDMFSFCFDQFSNSAVEIPKTCKILVEIERAVDLPRNTMKICNKKIPKRSSSNNGGGKRKQSRLSMEEEPCAYVTFHGIAGYGQMVKSHEGFVYATNVIEKNCNPIWEEKFEVPVPLELFKDNGKPFILKVWRKVSTDLIQSRLQPLPMEDVVIGFLSVDLNMLSTGTHISEWYNIIDHNGRTHGKLKIKIESIEDLDDIKRHIKDVNVKTLCSSPNITNNMNYNNMDFGNTPLSRAIKRKFTELEEITERLKARLLGVTGDLEPDEEENYVKDPILEAQLDEFEHDLNTACDENEFDENYENCSWLNLQEIETVNDQKELRINDFDKNGDNSSQIQNDNTLSTGNIFIKEGPELNAKDL